MMGGAMWCSTGHSRNEWFGCSGSTSHKSIPEFAMHVVKR